MALSVPPLHLETYLAILTLNCNGLREPRKRLEVASLLFRKAIGICKLAETHLRPGEADRLNIPNYYVVNKYCRDPASRIGGRAIIMARHSVNAKAVTLGSDAAPVMES